MPRFTNLDGSSFHPFSSVIRWAVTDRVLGRRHVDRRASITPAVSNDGSALRSNTNTPAITWVGHASWLVQLCGVNLLIDPLWSGALGGVVPRAVAPGVALGALPTIHAVLVSHNHRDHMDAPTLQRLTASRCVVGLGLGATARHMGFHDVTELEWWQAIRLGPVTVTFVPSQHWSRRSLADTNDSLWGGFLVEGGGQRVYHTGDTAYFSGFKDIAARLGSPDAALLPIGAYEPEWFMRRQHMNPEDALQAAQDLDARLVVPMHYGTFQLTDEWLGEPPQRFLQGAERDARLHQRVRMLPVGGTLVLNQT